MIVVGQEGLGNRLATGERTTGKDSRSACAVDLVRVTAKLEQLSIMCEMGNVHRAAGLGRSHSQTGARAPGMELHQKE